VRDRLRPAVVVACVGINNTWNETPADGARTWWEASRTYRLVRLLVDSWAAEGDLEFQRHRLRREVRTGATPGVLHRRATDGRVLVRHDGSPATRYRRLEEACRVLRADLATLRKEVEAAGARLVLLGYAAEPSPPETLSHYAAEAMTEEMQRFARENHLVFVDPRPRFREALASGGPRSQVFLSPDDSHPNAAGYSLVADEVADALGADASRRGPEPEGR